MAVTEFEKAVAERVEAIRKQEQEASMALINNEAFLNVQANISIEIARKDKLDTIIHQLNNGITPFIAKDGTKYSVRVFPISSFGRDLGRLMGIITGSSSAFTDEMALQYEAIVGVSFTELQITTEVLGTEDYINKDGIYVEGSRTVTKNEIKASVDSSEPLAGIKAVKQWEKDNISKLYILIQSIAVKLNMLGIIPKTEEDLSVLVARWEQSATRRATKQLEEIEKSATLNNDSSFTIED